MRVGSSLSAATSVWITLHTSVIVVYYFTIKILSVEFVFSIKFCLKDLASGRTCNL